MKVVWTEAALADAMKIPAATVVTFALVALLVSGAAAGPGDLYRADTIVTGSEEPNRSLGLAKCLEYVLVKVSGDPRVTREPGVAALRDEAATFVSAFHYRDLLEGIPIHDEQGTRDRPFELTVDFDPTKIDAALGALGREPWTVERPRIVVFVRVQNAGGEYALASDGARGRDQREALDDAAERLGIPLLLTDEAALGAGGLSVANLPAADIARLDALAKSIGGDLALAGSLVWDDNALGWVADWRLRADGRTYRWRISGVGFDEAFRNAAAGAVQILSGHGAPD